MSGQDMPGYVLGAVQSLADEMRQQRPSAGWRIVFPSWIIAQAGGWDAFVVRFEASHERTGLHHAGVIGFEVPDGPSAAPVRRHTMARYARDEESQ